MVKSILMMNVWFSTISKGNQVSLKVVFPNNVSKEMKYQWYDEDDIN